MAEKEKRCGNCRPFEDDPAVLEELFKGIGALSSTRGDSRGDVGICRLRDQYLLPVHSCEDFTPKK
jgi:hypothetical protein